MDEEPLSKKSKIVEPEKKEEEPMAEEDPSVMSMEEEYSSDSDTMPEVVGDEIDREDYSSDEFTEEKRQIYLKWSKKREGFAIPRFPKVSFFGMLVPASSEELTTDDNLQHFSQCAIEDHNKKMGEKLKMIRIIKCNFQLVGYAGYYITLEAQNEDSGRIGVYEISVRARSLEDYEVPIFREKERKRANRVPGKMSESVTSKIDEMGSRLGELGHASTSK